MYIYQTLFLSCLVAAFSLSLPKLLSVLLKNMDFRDLQQVSRESHRVLANLDIFSYSWPMNSRCSSRILLPEYYSWRNNTCLLGDPPCQSPLFPDRLVHQHLLLDGLDDSYNQPQIRLSFFFKIFDLIDFLIPILEFVLSRPILTRFWLLNQ